jgi:hypothetical protein
LVKAGNRVAAEGIRVVVADILAPEDSRVESEDSRAVADTRQEDSPVVEDSPAVADTPAVEDCPAVADSRQEDSPAAVADIQAVGVDIPVVEEDNRAVEEDNNLAVVAAHRRRSSRTWRRTCFQG